MKLSLHVAIMALALTAQPIIAPSANYLNYSGFTIQSEPTLPDRETHPSLWFTEDEEDAVRQRRHADAYASRLWEQITSSPFLTMDLPDVPPPGSDKPTVHQYFGGMSQFAMFNAFMGRMATDEDERARYIDRATSALLRSYDGDIYSINPNDSSTAADEIYRGTWAQSYAAAYDWVQPHLSAKDDAEVRRRLIVEMEYIHANLYDWASRPHNHLSKPAWGLASMALTLAEEPEAEAWLTRAIQASNDNTRYFFSEDGIYREGSMYYIFSLINFVPFLYHYRNVAGVDAFEDFQPVFEWPIAIRNGRGWMHNIEDSWIRPFPSQLVAGAYLGRSSRLNESGDFASVLQWNFLTTDYEPFDISERETGFNYSGASWDYPIALVEYLCYHPGIDPSPPTVSPTVFLDSGQTAFRNDWSFSDPDHRYLLFQGVAEADNHEHLDHLSFIIHAEDQMMASDGGYTRNSYGERIRTQWYRTGEAHNVVLVDGEAPGDFAENWTPPSRDRIDTPDFAFEEKEALYASGGTHARGIAFPRKNYFVIADRVTLPEAKAAEFVLHGGRATMDGTANHRAWHYTEDGYGRAAKMGAWMFPAAGTFQNKSGEVSYIKGDFAEFPYVTNTVTATRPMFLTILLPAGVDADMPAIEDLSTSAYQAVRVITDQGEDVFLLQPDNLLQQIAAVESDALFLSLTSGDMLESAFFQQARVVSIPGRFRSATSRPVTMALRFDEGKRVEIVVSSFHPFRINFPGMQISSLTFNGESIQLDEGADVTIAEIPGSGTILLEASEGTRQ